MAAIKAIYRYPVKSLGGESLESASVLNYGIEFDRNWMIIDENNDFVTQREMPRLTQFSAFIREGQLSIRDNADGDIISIPVGLKGDKEVSTAVWRSKVVAQSTDSVVDDWLSTKIGAKLRLVTVGQSFSRKKRFESNNFPVRFADGYPLLILGQASVDALNQKLETPVEADRFRTNILLEDCGPHTEDIAKSFYNENISFIKVKQCRRCIMVNTNQKTGEVLKEPLKTLTEYRKVGRDIMFGVNVFAEAEGDIKRGDKLEIEL